jgi:hypothetical protein
VGYRHSALGPGADGFFDLDAEGLDDFLELVVHVLENGIATAAEGIAFHVHTDGLEGF